jgi:hypothetical protein
LLLVATVAAGAWYVGFATQEYEMIGDRVQGAQVDGPVEKATFGAG